ncbi:LytR/AlgR family response regulator transcription factor [Pedobacter sp. UBA4863]|nr:LytTR family DNA-binding domain-containing protein [Pedobacter sp. UBA4863]
MRYSCIIIDDNEIERDLVEIYLNKIGFLEIKATCADAMQAIKILANEQIDIVFSDIDMPDLSGIELLKTIKNPPVFIFITSHLEHAVESFDLNALDFIAKPVSFERLLKAVNKATEYLNLKKTQKPENYQQGNDDEDFFFIKDNKGHIRVNNNEILYIESFGDFSKINLCNGEEHLALINLKNIELQLSPNNFIRIHRQFIINQNLITKITGNEITLNKQHVIPVGVSYRDKLMEHIDKKTLVRQSKG